MPSKINQLLLEWLPHDVHSLQWMAKRKVPRGLVQFHLNNGLLERVAPGIYKKAGDNVDWSSMVRLLQEEFGKNVHVSGKTALELVGAAHFGNLSDRPRIFLTTYTKHKLPVWLKKTDISCEFAARSSSLFKEEFFSKNRKYFLMQHEKISGIKIKISCRELAILEFIDYLDLKSSLETAENHVNMLIGARSKVIQHLLENCTSVKVKRVFMYLSEKTRSKYFNRLDLSKIDLGKGKRQIVKYNARLDKKYLITVDKDHDGDFL